MHIALPLSVRSRLPEGESQEAASRNGEDLEVLPSVTPSRQDHSKRGLDIGWILLFLLVAQNSSTALVGRHTRTRKDPCEVHHFIIATEVLKLVLSGILEHAQSKIGLPSSLKRHVIDHPKDGLRLLVPAVLCLAQNSIIFIALTYLPAPLFHLEHQSRLVTTTLLSVCFLGRTYSSLQWLCIFASSIGVAVVIIGEQKMDDIKGQSDVLGGSLLVAVACIFSSMAGVYFEKVIKAKSTSQDDLPAASLWMRNIQLSFFSCCFAVVQDILTPQAGRGFFQGFTPWVWLQVCMLGGGGLLVAAVVKHTDSVQKGLANGLSVLVTTSASHLIQGTSVSLLFIAGASLVVGGTFMFGQAARISEIRFDVSCLFVIGLMIFSALHLSFFLNRYSENFRASAGTLHLSNSD